MMKKIFLLVTFFVLGKMWSYAQYPITQNIGSDSTIVVSKGALQSRLINVTYPDTATANLQRIRQYPGAQIATTTGGINLWVRNTTATAWLPINTGSGNNIYTIDGTLTGNRTLTGNNYSLTFTGLSQFLLTVGNQTFTVRSDSASLTRKLSYASNRGSTFTLYSLVDKNYVDSAIASSPAGTVTQINTNNNTGITGGPITSTGTLAIDTLLISTRAWRQKGVDSLQANINLKLNIVDTTGMLANYVNSVGYGLGKTSQTVYVDSASLSNYYLRRKDSLTATNPLGYVTQKILADTAAAIRSSDLGGTVTSVATNNGTGITGGTITTSGTLAIDTTIISTRAWRQKGVDSLQANINLKLNISDTASMLNPYLRKVDTASLSNRINQKLNISDTASMLSPYLRSNTAAATYVPQTRTLTINGTTQDLSANRTYNVGTVTSVGLTMPAAFNVANSPVTGSGTLAVTGAGLASQYIRGDGTLANFPGGGGGGGASVSYYLNGSVNQGTFGGNTYYQMNKTPILGGGTNFTTNTNGYIAQFITNAGDPALLNIPAGNWNFELFFSASSGGGTPSYYVELYKYDGTTFTLIASGSSNPDVIVNSAVDAYFSALPVPQTTLTLTDRLAVRIYVTPAGRTITLHTEDNNLCQVVTTFTTGITAINSLTAQVQYLTTGTSGTDFNISSLTDTHTFNLPVASGTNTGKLSNTDWTTFNNKVGGSLVNGYITKATGTNTIDTSQLFQSNGLIGIGTTSPTQKLQVSGNAYVNGQLFAGDTALSVYQVEGILNTPYVLGRKAVNNTLSTEARPTGVMGHVVGRGSIANRLQAANFYTTTDSASTANSTGSLRSVNAWTAHNGSGSLATAWGSYNIVQNKTTGTITNAYGSVSGVENRGATSTINKLHGTTTEIWNNYGGTIDTAFGQVISIYNNNAASNIGAVYGLSIGKGLITPTGGTHYWRNSGTIGTSYGLYLDSSIDVGTTKYALFSNSNSNSYFRAKLGIGTTSPDSAFQVATGAYFQRGIRASGLPQAAGTKALRIDASGTISYADTLIDAGGTVTSVATNNGTGITGGTITTSGTLAIDTLRISTRAWRQKGVDSVAALANTKLSGSLISGYIPKATGTLTVDTSQIYQNNGNIGIGTISPASGFKVDMTGSLRVGNGSSYNNITINGSGAVGSYLRFQKNGTNKGDIGPYSAVLGGVPPYSGSNDDLTYSSVGGHFFNTNAGIKMYLTNAGNLGLSTSPDSMLTVLEGAYFQRGVRMSGLPSAPGTRALRINANGTLSVADTLVDAGGTVTSVATNNGTGITGGTITTTGTLAIDTLRISTRAWRQKGIDSVAALINSNVSGTTNYVAKFTGTNTIGNSQLFDNGTNVGIGTTSPTSKLELYNSSGDTRMTVTSTGGTGASDVLLKNASGSVPYEWYIQALGADGRFRIFDNTGGSTGERFTIDQSGNVGIGTSSPNSQLDVRGVIEGGNGTIRTVVSYTGSGGVTGTISSHPYILYANNNERMRITSSGNVLVGGTSDNGYKLNVTGTSYLAGKTNVQAGSIGNDFSFIVQSSPTFAFGGTNGKRLAILSDNGGDGNGIQIGYDATDGTGIVAGSTNVNGAGIDFYTYDGFNWGNRMRITKTGNVGIGTSSPSRTFQVNGYISAFDGTTNTEIVSSGGVGYFGTSTNHPLAFQANNTERMRIATTGAIRFNAYGSGSFTGTRAYDLSVDASGNIIEVPVGAGTITGSGTTNYIPKFTSSSAIGNSQIFDNGTNVGIGTASPNAASKLNVLSSGTSTSAFGNVVMRLSSNGSGYASTLVFSDEVANSAGISMLSGNLLFGANGYDTERMRLTSGGLLGLGTSSPNSYSTNANNLVVYEAGNAGITIATGTTNEGALYFADGTTGLDVARGVVYYNHTSNFMGFATDGAERMRLDASGNLGLGTSSPLQQLHLTGNILLQNAQAIRFLNSAAAQRIVMTLDGNDDLQLGGGIDNILFLTSSATRMTLDASGNLGLGVSPSAWGSGYTGFQIGSLSGLSMFAYSGGNEIGQNFYYDTGYKYATTGAASEYVQSGGVHYWRYAASGTANTSLNWINGMTLNSSGNLGLGVTPSAWGSGYRVIEGAYGGNFGFDLNIPISRTVSNGINNGTNWVYKISAPATLYDVDGWNGQFRWYTAPSGTAGTAISFTQAMTLDASGRLGIGTTSPTEKLDVNGTSVFRQIVYTVGGIFGFNPFYSNSFYLNNNGDSYLNVNTGRVGIGTTSPNAKMQIVGAGGARATMLQLTASGTSDEGLFVNTTGTGNDFYAIKVATGASANAFAVTNAGNVGIGTTSPAYKLDVAGSISNNSAQNIIYSSYDDVAALFQRVGAYGAVLRLGRFGVTNSTTIDYPADGTLAISTAGSERMRITSGGNVGIGTTSPNTKLEIQDAALDYTSALFNAQIITTTPQSIDRGGSFAFGGQTGGGGFTQFGAIRGGKENSTFAETGGYLSFMTRANAGPITDKMRITSAGNVGIGTTSPDAQLVINGSTFSRINMRAGDVRYGTIFADAGLFAIASITSNPLVLATNDIERMRITSGGNVLVGTTTDAGYKLNVNGSFYLGTNAYISYGATYPYTINIANTAGVGDIVLNAGAGSSGYESKINLQGGTSGYLQFSTASSERMRITSGGNVLVGTTGDAGYRLNVVSAAATIARFDGSAVAANSATEIDVLGPQSNGQLNMGVGGSTFTDAPNNVQNKGFITAGTGLTGLNLRSDAGFVQITAGGVTASNEVARFSAAGNVLVGTTTDAGYKFDVAGSLRNTTSAYFATSSGSVGIGTTSPDASTKLQVESSSSSSLRVVSSAASGGDLYITSVNGGSESRIDKQGTAGPLTFYNNGSERMRLTSGGELLINTTTDAGAYPLQVNGSVYATAYYESSDLRLKNVLSERQGSDGINTITFKWKDGRDSLTHIGYAAQQVEKVLPDAVKTNTDGYKTINYDEVQSLKIANLEQEIAELKKIIKQLIDKK